MIDENTKLMVDPEFTGVDDIVEEEEEDNDDDGQFYYKESNKEEEESIRKRIITNQKGSFQHLPGQDDFTEYGYYSEYHNIPHPQPLIAPNSKNFQGDQIHKWYLWMVYTFDVVLMCLYQIGWASQVLVYYSILLPKQVSDITGNTGKGKELGIVVLGGAIISIVGPPIFGIYTDRYKSKYGRRRPFMAYGTVVNALGLIISGVAGNTIAGLIIGNIIIQIGTNLIVTAFSATIPDMIEKDNFGSASGVLGILSIVGYAFGSIFGILVSHIGVLDIYLILATFTSLTSIITIYQYKEPSSLNMQVEKIKWGRILIVMWKPLMLHDFRWVCIIRFLMQMGINSVQQFLEFWVADVIPKSTMSVSTETALLFAPVGCCALISAGISGYYSDKFGNKRKIFLIPSCIGLAIVALAMIGVRSFEAALVVCVFFGFSVGIILSLEFALVYDILPNSENFARDLGVYHIAVVFPQLIAAPLTGTLLDTFNQIGKEQNTQYLGYTVVFLVTSIWFLLAACAFPLLRNVK